MIKYINNNIFWICFIFITIPFIFWMLLGYDSYILIWDNLDITFITIEKLFKSENINVRKQIAGLISETDILQGKLKLDQRSLAISNSQDNMIKSLNKYALQNPDIILNNPEFRKLAGKAIKSVLWS